MSLLFLIRIDYSNSYCRRFKTQNFELDLIDVALVQSPLGKSLRSVYGIGTPSTIMKIWEAKDF